MTQQVHQIEHYLIVGREREQSRLRDVFEQTMTGRGQLVLISGEAGIGKTTLVNDLAGTATERGTLILTGHCYDLTTTPPYGPWIEIIQSSPRIEGLPSLSGVLAGDATDEGIGARRQIDLQAWAMRLFVELASRQPLMLILDDLHWADQASLDALRLLTRDIGEQPILVIGVYRDDEVTRRHPLFTLLPVLVRESAVERITLRPLDTGQIEAWVGQQYALAGDDRRRLVEYLDHYSDGNPFFITELLQSLEDDRILNCDERDCRLGDLTVTGMPTLLRQVIERRLARVSDESRELLSIAAVIGHAVRLDLWSRVTGADPDTIDRTVAGALDAALCTTSETGITFSHALIREALYRDLLPSRRQVWHRRVAEHLLEMPVADPDEIAHHLRLAGDPRAVEWLTRAGDRAYREAFAMRTAAGRFEAALELIGTRNEALQVRGWLLLRLALVERINDPRRSLLLLNDAIEVASRTGDRALEAAASWNRGITRTYVGEKPFPDMETGHQLLISLTDSERQRLRQEISSRSNNLPHYQKAMMVGWYAGNGQLQRAIELADATDESTAGETTTPFRAYLHMGRALAYTPLGRVDEARMNFQRACQLFNDNGFGFHTASAVSFWLYDLVVHCFTDDLAERQRLAALLDEQASGQVAEHVVSHSSRQIFTPLYLIDGNWEEILAAKVEQASSPNLSLFNILYGLPTYAVHARFTGRRDEAWSLVRSMLPLGPATDYRETSWFNRDILVIRLAADLALDESDLETARQWIATHDRWLSESGAVLGRATTTLLQARFHRLAGDLPAAREQTRLAIELSSNPHQPQVLLAAYRMLGELETLERRFDNADKHLVIAFELAKACAMPYEEALTLLSRARLEAALSKTQLAQATLQAAREILERLGAVPALEEIAELQGELENRQRTSLLSKRETDVLRLVSDGFTDREVAERLYISPRTVNQHLRSIYSKFGVNSRAAATRYAVEHDLI